MNELPRSARELLQRARMTTPPPNGARERVRQGVERAVSPAAARKTAVEARMLTKGVAKLRLVGCAIAVAGGAALLLSHSHGEPTSANPATTSEAPVELATALPLALQPSASAATDVVDSTPTRVVSPQKIARSSVAHAQNTLQAEMVLLRDTSEAMNRGELARARTLLQQHRAQFAQGQLRAEREGLEVLARCLANETHASERAHAYLRRAPDGVLTTRIEKTCVGMEQP